MNHITRLLVAAWTLWSSDAGAYAGSGAGILASFGVWTGQLPVPDAVPTWLAMLLAGVPPALAWLATRLLPPLAAAARTVRDNSARRIARLEALAPDKQPDDVEAVIVRLEDRRDAADAVAEALEAFASTPKSAAGEQ